MADVSSDPYEQKLYQMFSSHDRGDSGSLDANDLRQLCHTLDLKDRETVLVEACLRNAEAHSGRVTFRGFKDGLLTLLGDGNCAGDSSENSAAIATAAAAPASATTADQDADDNNDGALKTTTTMVRNNGGGKFTFGLNIVKRYVWFVFGSVLNISNVMYLLCNTYVM